MLPFRVMVDWWCANNHSTVANIPNGMGDGHDVCRLFPLGIFLLYIIELVDKASAQTPTLYGADICQTDEADAHP